MLSGKAPDGDVVPIDRSYTIRHWTYRIASGLARRRAAGIFSPQSVQMP